MYHLKHNKLVLLYICDFKQDAMQDIMARIAFRPVRLYVWYQETVIMSVVTVSVRLGPRVQVVNKVNIQNIKIYIHCVAQIG